MSEPKPRRPVAHRHVAVLQVADPKVLDEIRAVLPLDHFVLATVSPTELVVDPARLGQLASRLADAGMTPLMKRARDRAAPQRSDPDPDEPTQIFER